MNRNKFHLEQPGVLRAEDAIVFVDAQDLTRTAHEAQQTERKRARICAHANDSSVVHEMFIVLGKSGYIRPHRHLNVYESFHLIAGSVAVLFFTESGELMQSTTLGDFGSGLPFYYRIPPNQFHSLMVLSESAFVHEVIQGPFNAKGVEFASWAPPESNWKAGQEFLRKFIAP